MQINLPPSVRQAIYVVTGISSIVVAYLSATHGISAEATTALTAANAFVAGLAAYNVSK